MNESLMLAGEKTVKQTCWSFTVQRDGVNHMIDAGVLVRVPDVRPGDRCIAVLVHDTKKIGEFEILTKNLEIPIQQPIKFSTAV